MREQLFCPIADVRLRPLPVHADTRGHIAEVFHAGCNLLQRPVQWNLIRSNANVVRGVHVHVRHVDYLVVLQGRLLLGLCDLREEMQADRASCLLELRADALAVVEIPAGVAHGFYFPDPGVLLHGASEYFDPIDDLACRWNDPGLNIPWPAVEPLLSERDQECDSLAELLVHWKNRWGQPNSRRQAG